MNDRLILGNAPPPRSVRVALTILLWAHSGFRIKAVPAATPAAVFRKFRRDELASDRCRDLLIVPPVTKEDSPLPVLCGERCNGRERCAKTCFSAAACVDISAIVSGTTPVKQ